MKNIVVLTGAGVSAESGVKTFRDNGGLWEGYDIMEVASPLGWQRNKEVVLNFYNERRKQLHTVQPNAAHKFLAALEPFFKVQIITQNVDDLHERAGSSNVLHLHGELLKVRSTTNENLVYAWENDLKIGDLCEENSQLRPHIVWFGESVPLFETAIEIASKADIFIIVGTSMQVYPAAALINYIPNTIPVYFVDPKPTIQKNYYPNLKIIAEKASVGVEMIFNELTA